MDMASCLQVLICCLHHCGWRQIHLFHFAEDQSTLLLWLYSASHKLLAAFRRREGEGDMLGNKYLRVSPGFRDNMV